MSRIGGGPHPPAPSPSQSDREGVWIPACAGMMGRGEGLDCGLRRNDERLGAIYRAPTRETYPCELWSLRCDVGWLGRGPA